MADSRTPPDALDGIAIIGMAGRFPGARTLDDFWHNLIHGVETISFFSDQELAEVGVDPGLIDDPSYVKACGILDDIDLFDAAFFGIPPREAEVIDPQQRIFLECAWEALEQAGYDSESYAGWIGVFAGVGMNAYLLNNLFPNRPLMEAVGSMQATITNDRDYLPTRVSYKLNLKGPSVNVQSACSTSLVAVHLGAQSLLNGECDMALAGGVSVRVPQKAGYIYQDGGIISPDGHSRAFDAQAQGTIFSSGVGVVVLKRLADALADGDTIYAVIKGSAINNDGALKVGFTAPGVDGQAAVVAMAQAVAGVEPDTISYVEAHGTGTALGDPVEVAALTQVFRGGTQRVGFCGLGSVKTNIGHTNAASGVAGLIKTVLALRHEVIPPSLHYSAPNPQIDFANSPFYVVTRPAEWRAGATPRRAGVSSFGIGGTNAHIILEEAPAIEPSGPSRPWQLLVLSARTPAALETATANLAGRLRERPDAALADIAYTLQVGRRHFDYRRALVCRDRDEALDALTSLDAQRAPTRLVERRDRPVAFLLSGQGAQYPGMARGLYESEPLFREQIDRCAALLRPHLGIDIREVLYPDSPDEETRRHGDKEIDALLVSVSPGLEPGSRTPTPHPEAVNDQPLNQTWLAQPALFVIEYALAQLWMSWGIRPRALIGHSVGEYVAACLAGVFSLEDALKLVAARGQLMQQLPEGAMLAVSLPENELRPLLGTDLTLAAVNGPARCVAAGPPDAISALERRLAAIGATGRRLHTSHAFHSPMVEPVMEAFAAQVRQIELRPPQIPYISNLTGTWIADEQATDPHYWVRHLREPVRFSAGVAELLREPERVLLEVGPGQMLATLARLQAGPDRAQDVLTSLRHPQEPGLDQAFLLHALGKLWLAGARPDWAALYADERRLRLPLPTYPFERQRYWVEPAAQPADRAPLRKEPDIADWFYLPIWKQSRPPALLQQAAGADEGRCWLVLLDTCGLGARLSRRLEQAGRTVVTVEVGERFARLDERSYTLNPAQREEYAALLGELRQRGMPPGVIVHLWSVGPEAAERDVALAGIQTAAFDSLIYLAQALGDQPATGAVRIAIISNGLQEVTGDEALRPEKALLLGPCRVIPQEYAHTRCRSIDMLLPLPGTAQERRLLDQLAAELAAAPSDQIIAFRGSHRWVQSYEPLPLAAEAGPTRLREGGVYLITGGLGGMGLALAEQLARSTRARLALLGRSALPARVEWDDWLAAHPADDLVSRTIRQVRAIEAHGAEVLVLRADVTDEAALAAALRQIHERFGALHGVVHAAGVPGGGLIQLKTPEAAAQVLAPKLRGARALAALLSDTPLDFFILCSSTTAITGGVGQVDYCAANAFLDAFARANTAATGTFTLAINWAGWQQVGMAAGALASRQDGQEQPAAQYTPIAHPLLDARIESTAERDVYLTELSATTHWILDEHRILGNPVVPGTAYLEIVQAAFAPHAAGQAIEIRDVFLLAPLRVAEHERREVRTVLERDGAEHRFQVLSAPGSGGAWVEHARGRVAAVPALSERRELAPIIARCDAIELTLDVSNQAEQIGAFVSWGPRWRNLKSVCAGAGEGLALLELGEEFAADLAQFTLHPALLDVATAVCSRILREGVYLPLSYGRLTIQRRLPGRLYSHITYRDQPGAGRETATFDIVLLDEDGLELVTIEAFTLRRIGEEAAARLKEPAPAQPEFAPARQWTMTPQEGMEVFRRALAAESVAQLVVQPVDLAARLAQFDAEAIHAAPHTPALGADATHPRPELRRAYVAPSNKLEQTIADIWQKLLGIDRIGTEDSFFELGGDSLLVAQLVLRLREIFPVEIPLQIAFEASTIAALAEAIEELLTEKLESLSEEEAQRLVERLL